ncbi:hypothetical protein E2C01_062689 [Portunus trituberculatus]|uniref:Uncharacterized protein n=1 Tax=Portunus trituberculatus TaxID=210409 RepID=A0A5B7HGS1_PORTR|nr:hypothetical protein [Portunus trituberculatus]
MKGMRGRVGSEGVKEAWMPGKEMMKGKTTRWLTEMGKEKGETWGDGEELLRESGKGERERGPGDGWGRDGKGRE